MSAATTAPTAVLAPVPEGIGGYGYAIGVSVGMILIITALTMASFYCTRNATTTFVLPQTNYPNSLSPPGLDVAVLSRFPKLLYSEAKVSHDDSTATCCSICLADYKDSDMLRGLPDCGHLFHQKCVDPWLLLRPTCPVCRTSSPLAEVVPPATGPAV